MRYFVEVVPPGEPGTRHEVSAGFGTLGTGAGDIVRLPGGSIAGPAALRLSVDSGGVEISSRDSACSFTYLGQSCKWAVARWGDEVFLGATRLTLVAQEGKKRRASPLFIVVAIFALLFAIGGVLRLSDPGFLRGRAPEPPVLASSEVPCRATTTEAARMRAKQARDLGYAKEERYPFSRVDGIHALQLYREASSCFKKAGLSDQDSLVREQLKSWSMTVERDFRDLRLRLDFALRDRDTQRALVAARALESMLSAASEEPPSDYGRWLLNTKKHLQAEVSKMNGRKVQAKVKKE